MRAAGVAVRVVGAIVALAFLVYVAYAASLSTGTQRLGAGSATVGRCAVNGIAVTQNLSGSNVVSVTIAGIAGGCGNGSLSVTVNNGSANSSGTGTVPSAGGSMTVNLASAVAAKDVEEIDVAISGP
jgi:hypothetical protein